MKKKIIIAVVLLSVLTIAVRLRFALAYMIFRGDPIRLDRSEIEYVSGTSVTAVPVRNTEMSESQVDSFAELFNSLELKRIPVRNREKGGWLYSFYVKNKDGSAVMISFLDNGLVTVDGYDCVTLKSVPENLEEFF